MDNFITRKIDREKLKRYYFLILQLLNSKYRRSLRKVKSNFTNIDEQKTNELYQALLDNYFNCSELSPLQKNDMENHMFNRLFAFRHRAIPWINSLMPLKESKVLEIGCGTGCTSIALAEQGCTLTGIDVADIQVAKKRCELYGLSANIMNLNATQICELDDEFDLIIFSDSMEHMTYKERIASIKQAWGMLKNQGFIIVLGAPNRLHYFDRHSSRLHFYHWLPDEIAMQYSKYSPRDACASIGNDEMKFIRFGRGVSYHEFEIALDIRCADFECFCMQSFLNAAVFSYAAHRSEYRFRNILRKFGPSNIPKGFYYEQLQIAIKKT